MRYIAIYHDISQYIDISIKTKPIWYRNRFQISIAIFDNIVISPKLTTVHLQYGGLTAVLSSNRQCWTTDVLEVSIYTYLKVAIHVLVLIGNIKVKQNCGEKHCWQYYKLFWEKHSLRGNRIILIICLPKMSDSWEEFHAWIVSQIADGINVFDYWAKNLKKMTGRAPRQPRKGQYRKQLIFNDLPGIGFW